MPEISSHDLIIKQLLLVVAMGNLSLFVIINHQFITRPVFCWYLALLIILTEIIFIVDTYSNCVIQRRQQTNLRQWPATTNIIREVYQKGIYHIYFMNVLLSLVIFGQGWEYTNYICGAAYSYMLLLTL